MPKQLTNIQGTSVAKVALPWGFMKTTLPTSTIPASSQLNARIWAPNRRSRSEALSEREHRVYQWLTTASAEETMSSSIGGVSSSNICTDTSVVHIRSLQNLWWSVCDIGFCWSGAVMHTTQLWEDTLLQLSQPINMLEMFRGKTSWSSHAAISSAKAQLVPESESAVLRSRFEISACGS